MASGSGPCSTGTLQNPRPSRSPLPATKDRTLKVHTYAQSTACWVPRCLGFPDSVNLNTVPGVARRLTPPGPDGRGRSAAAQLFLIKELGPASPLHTARRATLAHAGGSQCRRGPGTLEGGNGRRGRCCEKLHGAVLTKRGTAAPREPSIPLPGTVHSNSAPPIQCQQGSPIWGVVKGESLCRRTLRRAEKPQPPEPKGEARLRRASLPWFPIGPWLMQTRDPNVHGLIGRTGTVLIGQNHTS